MKTQAEKEATKRWRAKNRKRYIATIRRWGKKNPEKVREWAREGTRRHNARMRDKAFKFLGDKCARCGFTDRRALQIDHVNGDGWKDKNRARCGDTARVRRDVFKNPSRYQILCSNCNWIKRFENNEHRRPKGSVALITIPAAVQLTLVS